MRWVFKNAWFERVARKQNMQDRRLRDGLLRVEQGLIDADFFPLELRTWSRTGSAALSDHAAQRSGF